MTPKIVGVIFSRADLQRALKMSKPPDFFELRLDRLIHCLDAVSAAVERLPAPLIITARHPREGGANHLSAPRRRAALLRFLPAAAWLDVELRSAFALRSLWQSAQAAGVRRIISFHDFEKSPSTSTLDKKLAAASSLGADIFKVAARTDTPTEFRRLVDFFARKPRKPVVVAMGIGKLGSRSRLALARQGCAFNYGHLGSPAAPGQLSVSELRRALR